MPFLKAGIFFALILSISSLLIGEIEIVVSIFRVVMWMK